MKSMAALFGKSGGKPTGEDLHSSTTQTREAKHVDECCVSETKKVLPEEFFKRARQKARCQERGETEEMKKHWCRERRWEVRIWDVRLENVTAEPMVVFVNFIFGGDREEFLIREDSDDLG